MEHYTTGDVSIWKGNKSHPYSPRSGICFDISNDILLPNKWKESSFTHIGTFNTYIIYIEKIITRIQKCVQTLKKNLATLVKGNPKAPFSIATTPRYQFTLDPYLIMLSVKQGGIKNYFLSFWYDSTWDWTLVSRTIGKHSIY